MRLPATVLILAALLGCRRVETSSTKDTTASRDIQLPNADTTLALRDRPVAPAPAPQPARPAPKLARPPAKTPAKRSATTPAPAPAPAPPPAPTVAPSPAPAPIAPPSRVRFEPPVPPLRLAEGTAIEATATREITSKVNKPGELFTARIGEAIAGSDGRVVIPAGSELTMTIVEIKPAPNQGAKDGTLVLRATSVNINGRSRPLDAEVTFVEHTLKGRGVGTEEAAKVGAGVVGGAIIGKVIAGGKGAVAGAVTGAAAGAAVAVQTADRDVVIPAGGKIRIALRSALIPD